MNLKNNNQIRDLSIDTIDCFWSIFNNLSNDNKYNVFLLKKYFQKNISKFNVLELELIIKILGKDFHKNTLKELILIELEHNVLFNINYKNLTIKDLKDLSVNKNSNEIINLMLELLNSKGSEFQIESFSSIKHMGSKIYSYYLTNENISLPFTNIIMKLFPNLWVYNNLWLEEEKLKLLKSHPFEIFLIKITENFDIFIKNNQEKVLNYVFEKLIQVKSKDVLHDSITIILKNYNANEVEFGYGVVFLNYIQKYHNDWFLNYLNSRIIVEGDYEPTDDVLKNKYQMNYAQWFLTVARLPNNTFDKIYQISKQKNLINEKIIKETYGFKDEITILDFSLEESKFWAKLVNWLIREDLTNKEKEKICTILLYKISYLNDIKDITTSDYFNSLTLIDVDIIEKYIPFWLNKMDAEKYKKIIHLIEFKKLEKKLIIETTHKEVKCLIKI